MSYATGTTHYNLPQTVGTDKRDWFDTNQAFSDIDAAIYGAVQTAETAEADLTSVTTRVGTLETDVASLETTTDTHSSNISTLQTSVTQISNAVTDNKQDLLDMIESTQEASATASYAHAVGSYFIYNDTLYVTTVAIAVGDTIVPNTNCETTDIGTVLAQLNSDLADIEERLSDKTQIGTISTLTDGVFFTVPSDGYIRINERGVVSFKSSATPDSPTPLLVNRIGSGTDAVQRLSVFVRKGMNVKWDNEAGTGVGSCAFFPLED